MARTLLKHVSSKMSFNIIYAGMVESTNMSMTLPAEKLVTIIRAFSYEMSVVAKSYNGYVLKYVGDADYFSSANWEVNVSLINHL